jgi:hypothetical protein
MDKIIKITIGCVIIISLSTCKKEKEEITKGETEAFLYGTGNTVGDFQNSEGAAAINDIITDPPPFMPFSSLKKNSLFGKTKETLNKILSWADSIKCIYGTWTHTEVQKPDTDYCGREFYSFWDYVHDDTTGINLKWKFLFNGDTHQAYMRLYNIGFACDTLLSSLSMNLKSDDKPVLNADFSAEYNPNCQPIKGSLTFKFENVGEFKITIEAKEGHTLEDTLFVGKVSGYVINFKNNNYRLDYYFENWEDSSMTFWFSDSKGWKFLMNLAKPVHTSHPGYDPHYYQSVSGEITKSGKFAASIKGEIWVTDPPDDPIHQTWIHIVFRDGTEKDIRQYIPIGSFIFSLLK